jgi:hypothetical protein
MSIEADKSQTNTAIAKKPGTVYMRCKVSGGETCSNGCYSETKKAVINSECNENETIQCGVTNAGACQYGNKVCENGRWSECIGSINPMLEICNNGVDDDCDGAIDETCGIQDEEILAGDSINPVVYAFDNINGSIKNIFNLTGLHSGTYPRAIGVGDVNNDSKVEIIVGTSYDTTARCVPNCYNMIMFYRNEAGTWKNFYNSTSSSSMRQNFYAMAVGDVNNDSIADVVAAGDQMFSPYSPAFVIYFNNSASKNFTEKTLKKGVSSYSLAIGDLNKNGINEIFIEEGMSPRKILIYEWNGTIFANRANISLGASDVIDQMDVGDLNNNTNTLELLACGPGTGSTNTFRIYNWSSGTTYNLVWTSPNLDNYPQSCGIVDLNNNGVNDIVAMTNKMRFFEYNGTNGNVDFMETWNSTQTSAVAQRAADSGDIDRDGKAEFVTDYGSANFSYFQNDTSEQAGPPFANITLYKIRTAGGTCVADIDGI